MSRKILLVGIALSLALTACAPGTQAQIPAATQALSSDTLPDTSIELEASEPAQAQTLSPTPIVDWPGAYKTSVLVTEWIDREKEHQLYLLDPDNGQAHTDYAPISLGEEYYHAFSPDRRTLAIARPGSLLLIDLLTWKERVFDLRLGVGGFIEGVIFDPEGSRLAITYGSRESKVAIFDLVQEAVTVESWLDIHASRLKFTAGGDGLMIYGTAANNRSMANETAAGPPKVLLLDADDLSLRWSSELEGVREGIYPQDEAAGGTVDISEPGTAIYFYPGLAFAPDRDALYVVHPDEDKLTTVDFTAQNVMTVDIHTQLSWFERLLSLGAVTAHAKVIEGTSKQMVASPDGRFLYVVGLEDTPVQNEKGEWQAVSTPLGLQVIRSEDGARLARLDTEAVHLSISPNGRFLYLGNAGIKIPWTDVVDTSTIKVVARLDGDLRPVYRLDGEMLLASSDWIEGTGYRTAVIDPQSLAVLAEWTDPQYTAWLSTP